MKFRLLPVVAAAALLAACSTAPDEDAGAAGAGTGTGAGTGSGIATQTGPSPGSADEFMAVVGDRVYFGFDKYDLTSEAQSTLRNQAAWLNRYRDRSVLVEGHADERGTREYNLALGERRANSVREFLISQGVDGNRVRVVSYGKERPVCGESNEGCWTENRRGVTVLQ